MGLTAAGAFLQQAAAPLQTFAFFPAAMMLVAALIAGAVMIHFVDKRPVAALGFGWNERIAREALVGLLIGGGALLIAVLLLSLFGVYRFQSDSGDVWAYVGALFVPLVLFGIAAAAEEALFRGYPFQVLVRAIGSWPAAVIASGLFAWAHHNNPGVDRVALLNIFLAGVLLSFAYLRTRSLWFATAVHLGWNWTMATLLDLPVSGLRLFDTPLYDTLSTGPTWLTGGGFGPEAGVLGSLAFVGMAIALVRVPGIVESERMRALRPIVDDRLTAEKTND